MKVSFLSSQGRGRPRPLDDTLDRPPGSLIGSGGQSFLSNHQAASLCCDQTHVQPCHGQYGETPDLVEDSLR